MENNRYREEEKEEMLQEDNLQEDNLQEDKLQEDNLQEDNQEANEPLNDEQFYEDTNEKETKNQKNKNNKYKKKIHHLEEQLAIKDEELKNVQNEMLKDRAELENFKKRTADERLKERKYANQYLIEDLLDMIDIFDTQVNKEVDDDKLKKYLMGFKMIDEQIKDILSRYGLSKIDCLNKDFNPSYHEAIETVEGAEDGKIVEVVRNGYMYKDRVIRPSKVKVTKKAQEENNNE